ncbi:MAG TPA: hypothetical protein VLT33_12100 [Labilithrix sp.]|nr:hypothetical protein [Labilithrix sp.]
MIRRRPFDFRPMNLARLGIAAGISLATIPLLADSEITPPPASIGADVPVTYFGPPPSSVEPELIGPHQLLTAGKVDLAAGTVKLPLYKGRMKDTGKTVWYVLTDTSDKAQADALGLNHSAKLEYAATCKAARNAEYSNDGSVVFEQGTVDFSPVHSVTPGDAPNAFPPKAFQPGSVGDADYSPLVRIGGVIFNAPIVAFGVEESDLDHCTTAPDYAKVHDKVVNVCAKEHTVTLRLTNGFSFSRPIVYISMDSNDALASSLESATLAPGLNDVVVGRDDSFTSGVERLFAVTNGPTNTTPGEVNPQRQGFASALMGEGSGPLNVFGGIPTLATDYSPLWDVNLGEWTKEAIDNGYRSRVTDEFTWLGLAVRGFVTGPGGKPYGSTGIIINCPPVSRLL